MSQSNIISCCFNKKIKTNMVSNEFDLSLSDRQQRQIDCPSRRLKLTEYEPTKFEMIKSKLLYILLPVIALVIITICVGLLLIYEKGSNVTHSIDAWKDNLSAEQKFWYDNGLEELKHGLKVEINTHRAKNVILFVGDGMGINTLTASRIYKYGEEGRLAWEEFPHMGMLKVREENSISNNFI